jgi:hypothetical protein
MSSSNEQITLKRIDKFTVFYGLEAFCQHKNIDFEMFKQKLIEKLGCHIYQPEDDELVSHELNLEVISNQFIVRGKFIEKYVNNIIKNIL